ncbi:hypothetical protein PS2_038785 [Malus domestica]
MLQRKSTLVQRNFGGKKAKNGRGIHWMKWEPLCTSKADGGLGFRELESFNQSLLAKQCWRLFINPTSLVSRMLSARYFPNDSFLNAGIGTRPSYVRLVISGVGERASESWIAIAHR